MQIIGPGTPGEAVGGGRYRLLRRLGGGSFGETYLAHDSSTESYCVVKRATPATLASPSRRHTFDREARALASLNLPGHPHIPAIYAFLPDEHSIVLEYIDGESLGDLIRRRGRLPVAEALGYARSICSALIYLHSRLAGPILHRDLKPDNLLRDSLGQIWLIDFGLVAGEPLAAGEPPPIDAGTPGFTPAEQWLGHAEPRSDVYALGATLCAMLTGRRPVLSPSATLRAVREAQPTLAPGLLTLLEQSMAEAVEGRPTATMVLAALDALLAELAPPLPPAPARPPPPPSAVGQDPVATLGGDLLRQAPLFALTGPSGAGKTALAAHLARAEKGRPVFWFSFDDPGNDDLPGALAAFLAHHGLPDVWRHRRDRAVFSLAPISPTEATLYTELRHDLRGLEALLCLDAVPKSGAHPEAERLCAALAEEAEAGFLRLLITAESTPAWAASAAVLPLATGPSAARALQAAPGALPTALAATLGRIELTPRLALLVSAALRASTPAVLVEGALAERAPEAALLLVLERRLAPAAGAALIALATLHPGGTAEAVAATADLGDAREPLAWLADHGLVRVYGGAAGDTYAIPSAWRAILYEALDRQRRRAMHCRAAAFYEAAGAFVQAAQQLVGAGDHLRAARIGARLARQLDGGELAGGVGPAYARLVLAGLQGEELAEAERAALCTVRGELALQLGDMERAEAELRSAVDLGAGQTTAEERTAQCRRYAVLARIALQRGAYPQAEASCDLGLALAKRDPTLATEVGRLLLVLAELRCVQSAYAEATAACEQGLAVLPPAPAEAGLRLALRHRRATVLGEQGAYEAAVASLEALLPAARATGDRAQLAAVLNNLGGYCQYLGLNERARVAQQESLAIKVWIGDLDGQVASLINLAWLALADGDGETAAAWFGEALRRSERRGLLRYAALALLNLGQIALEQGEPARAVEALDQASRLYADLGDDTWTASSLYLRGDAALAAGRPDEAAHYGALALALAERAGSDAMTGAAERVLAEAALAMGDLAGAEVRLDRADALQAAVGDPFDTAMVRAAQARLAAANGDRQAAGRHAAEALGLAHRLHIAHVRAAMEALLQAVPAEVARAGPGGGASR